MTLLDVREGMFTAQIPLDKLSMTFGMTQLAQHDL